MVFIARPTQFLEKWAAYRSEEIILQLITSKCLPILFYCLVACPLTKNDLNSLDFVINRFFMKLLKTSDINIVKTCQSLFSFDLPGIIIEKRAKKFKTVYDITCV